MHKLIPLAAAGFALIVAPALAAVKPVKGQFADYNPSASIFVKKDRTTAQLSGTCPTNGRGGLRYFPGIDVKVKGGKIDFAGKVKFVDEETGTTRRKVIFKAEFVTEKKATGFFRVKGADRAGLPTCDKKLAFKAIWKPPIPPGQG